jgi:colanic acid/amylovoran biosynthesis glycosyltransferase
MKIAMVVPQFPCFGETYILSQITGLIDLGQEVDVIAVNPSGESTIHEDVFRYKLLERTRYLHLNEQYGKSFLARLRNGCVCFAQNFWQDPRSTLSTLNPFRYGRQALRLAYLFRLQPFIKTQYDVVHCHFGPNARSFLFLKDIRPVRLLASFHGYDFSRVLREQGREFYRELFERADWITVNSQYGREKLLAAGGNDEKMSVLPESLPTERFVFRERTLPPGKPLRILTVARLFEKKGYEYSVRAVAKVAERFPNLVYWIVGDPNGPAAPRIRELIRELDMEDRIQILGTKTREQLIEIQQQCHLFVLASVTASDGDEEGQGLVLQEAQAAGMPVLATRHNGLPESLVDGESGFLVPERDVDALAERIHFLATHPGLWPAMGNAGRAFVESKFDSNKLNLRLLELYQGIQAEEFAASKG